MAKTRGTARLPLPESLTAGLTTLGFVSVDDPAEKAPHYRFRIVRHPKFVLDVASSNMPGDAAVIVSWTGQFAQRLHVDALLTKLEEIVAVLNHPNRVTR